MFRNKEEFYIKTTDGIKIALNHYKGNCPRVLIIANGWTMSKDSKFIEQIAESFFHHLDVISFDFRGHGKSSGYYTFTKNESNDLKTVVDYAKSKYKTIYLIGFSLGGAISTIYCADNNCISKLVIVSAPKSFENIKHFRWLKDFLVNPFNKYEFKICTKLRPNPFCTDKIRPIDVVDKICIPTLFIAGELDDIIPFEDTKSLYEKAQCEKHFELLENCNHAEDIICQQKTQLVKASLEWILKD